MVEKKTKKGIILVLSFLCACFLFAAPNQELGSWLDAPSLKEAFAGKIDYIGVAVPHTQWPSNKKILPSTSVQSGMEHHFS